MSSMPNLFAETASDSSNEAATAPESNYTLGMSSGVSIDEFQALELKVLRAVEIVKQEREARAVAEAEVVSLRQQLAAQAEAAQNQIAAAQSQVATVKSQAEEVQNKAQAAENQIQAVQSQVEATRREKEEAETKIAALNQERDEVRQRVERMLQQMDELL